MISNLGQIGTSLRSELSLNDEHFPHRYTGENVTLSEGYLPLSAEQVNIWSHSKHTSSSWSDPYETLQICSIGIESKTNWNYTRPAYSFQSYLPSSVLNAHTQLCQLPSFPSSSPSPLDILPKPAGQSWSVLCVALVGQDRSCHKFLGRSDQNCGYHGTQGFHRLIMGWENVVRKKAQSFLIGLRQNCRWLRAYNKHKFSKAFEFCLDRPIHFGVTYPWVEKMTLSAA